jgi:hypothetical protein
MDNLGIDAAIAECTHAIDRIQNHIQHMENGLRHFTDNGKLELNLDCTSREQKRELAALKLQENYLMMYQDFKENVPGKAS